ncbi:MAG: DUF2066 domain-containing protein, partial [Gammaproteobacteria bacterium]|nr:DUF2066 domain-containing protein [Gammaproteobacteria bacterium]
LIAAMRQILLRVSGRSIVLTITAIEQALEKPTRYVQQYRYRKPASPTTTADGQEEQTLWVRFDQKAINKLLRDNRMPVWGKTRPSVLLWMVVDNRKTRVLVGNNVENEALTLIQEQARLRGLPLRLPLLDLADQSNLSMGDVWGNFEDTILLASRRYQAEAVLVGRVYQAYSGNWTVRWTLYNSGRRDDWDATGLTLVEALIPGIDNTVDTLAQYFAQVEAEGEDSSILVKVQGIYSLANYNKAIGYLSALSAVTEVQPYSVAKDNVMYRLKSRNGRLAISQAISLGHTLVEVNELISEPIIHQPVNANRPEPGVVQQLKADLVYRLIP